MSNANILDLDKIIPEKRIVKLAGEEIDVSKIPSRVTMEISNKADVFASGDSNSFNEVVELVVKICKPSKPDITSSWIIDNTDITQLMALLEFVMAPLREKAEESKNQQAPTAKSLEAVAQTNQ